MQLRTRWVDLTIAGGVAVALSGAVACTDDSEPSAPADNSERDAQVETDSGGRAASSEAGKGGSKPAAPTNAAGAGGKPATEPEPPSSADADAGAAIDSQGESFLRDAGDGWKNLVIGDWEIAPGDEGYRCVRVTLPKDLSLAGMRALSPVGTHHTLLTIADDTGKPDGTSECEASTNGRRSIAGSGVGTNDFFMPEGVAMQLKAGQQLLLNLHLFNVSDKPLRGTSGTLVKLIEDKDVVERAEGILAGTVALNLPPKAETTQRGSCTMTGDYKLFAVSPHMHQLGVHLKAVAHSSVDGEVVLHDGPYSFDEQLMYALPKEVHMKAGDKVDVECTYNNTTDKAVKFGDSSKAEMCFAGIYRYPASATDAFTCIQ